MRDSSFDDHYLSLKTLLRVYVFNQFLALHCLGIKHGDVRPSNVVHGIDTDFRIIDFSLSEDHDCPEKEGIRPVNSIDCSSFSEI